MDKLTWKTQEYLHREKTSDWYWIVGIVTISITLIAIILNNVIFAILILISSITLSLFASKKPGVIDVSLENTAIFAGVHKYPYKEIEAFWVESEDNHERLLLKLKRTFAPLTVIFIDEVDTEDVRNYLLQRIREEELSEPLLEKILIYLGF